MEELIQKVSNLYEELQTLDIKPTKHNTGILDKAYTTLEEVYRKLKEVSQNAEVNN